MCIHVSQQQVSRYERGINQINIDLLAELSFLFGVPIFEFLKKE
ncbi:helix-turn-helix domain-containing protein [Providencia rettgeri]